MSKNVTYKDLKKILATASAATAVMLALGGGLAWWGSNFANSTVHDQLAQEKITFPKAGSPALDPKTFPTLQQYAGQAVDTGVKAKAYANEYIWVHMMKASGGKTYAEVSAEAMANKSDQKLAALKNTLFQGDMLRSSLLTAYAFSVFGRVAWYVMIVAFVGAALFALLSVKLFARAARS